MTGRPLWRQIKEPFEKWLSLPNYDVVEVVAATVIANRLPGEPLWLAVVGPSSSGKTEVVRALEGVSRIHQVDNFTAGTLASGFREEKGGRKEGDYGLLKKMMDGKPHIITIGDFSTLLKGRYDVRDKVMSQLRKIYDGTFDATYGNNVRVEWRGKIGLIACSTGVYDVEMPAQQAFGDRFLVCRSTPGDPVAVAEKAGRNAASSQTMRRELRGAMKKLDKIGLPSKEVQLPLDVRELLSRLTAFVARARTQVPRDVRSKEMTAVPEIEGTGRMSGQLHQLLRGMMVLRNSKVVTEDDVELVERVAMGTVPSLRMKVIEAMNPRFAMEASELEVKTNIPRSVLYRTLEDMKILELIDWEQAGGESRRGAFRPRDEWKVFFHYVKRVNGERR